MKRLVAVLAFFAAVSSAQATCTTGAMPFQLQNNTLADATQVMANFNQISSGVAANCAGSGANNDITSLSSLVTPLNPSQGGTTVFNGGQSSGTNALTISTVPSNFTLTVGNRVSFIAGGTNTAVTSANVQGTGSKSVFRKTQIGAQSTQGGELLVGNTYSMVYDGTEYVLDTETIIIGEMKDYVGVSAPPGWFIADGSSFVCATFQQLCNLIGTSFGGSASNPNLPDTRGRILTGLDNYGTSTGAANRLTSAGTGCGSTFTGVGATCANGSQSHTQVTAEVGQHNHTITDPGHTHSYNTNSAIHQDGASINDAMVSPTSQTTGSSTTGITINNSPAAQAMPIVPNVIGVVKIIRF